MKGIRLNYGSTIPGQENLSSDLLWRTGFKAPDPFFFYESGGNKAIILANSLEYERAKKESHNCEVILIDPFVNKTDPPTLVGGFIEFLKSRNCKNLLVHDNMPTNISDRLRDEGFDVTTTKKGKLWYPDREIKTNEEISNIENVQMNLEEVMWKVVELLREASVSKEGILKDLHGEVITAEGIKDFMDLEFARMRCFAEDTIVACGDQAVDPHCSGFGPLRANLPIVFDVFPRSKENWYWSDMSRTFFKGEPTDEARKMYEAVLEAQYMAIDMVSAGSDFTKTHLAVVGLFNAKGYKTGIINKTMQGYIHGLGHGVGLDIHEAPKLRRPSCILCEGSLVTVEPGLYYLGIGGVRIEDLVVVTKDGCRNLTKFPKELKDMIIP